MLVSGSTVNRNRKKEGVDMGGKKLIILRPLLILKIGKFFFTYY